MLLFAIWCRCWSISTITQRGHQTNVKGRVLVSSIAIKGFHHQNDLKKINSVCIKKQNLNLQIHVQKQNRKYVTLETKTQKIPLRNREVYFPTESQK
jgi:hypothetical protein